jgi:hypothetical protein
MSKEELRQNMIVANEKQKDLLKQRDLLLQSKDSEDAKTALRITHEIAKLQDFIRMAEKTLRMSD